MEKPASDGRRSDVATGSGRVEPRVSDAAVHVVLDAPQNETNYYASKDSFEKIKERIGSGYAGERTYEYKPEQEGIHKQRRH